MNYMYLGIWLLISIIFKMFSKILVAPINKIFLFLKFRDCSVNERAREFEYWKNDYNRTYFDFPNGWIINWVFGCSYGFVVGVTMIVAAYFVPAIFESVFISVGLLISIGIWIFYDIFYRSMPWLKENIQKRNKKFYI